MVADTALRGLKDVDDCDNARPPLFWPAHFIFPFLLRVRVRIYTPCPVRRSGFFYFQSRKYGGYVLVATTGKQEWAVFEAHLSKTSTRVHCFVHSSSRINEYRWKEVNLFSEARAHELW